MITTCTLLLILSFTSIALSVSFSLVRETRRSCFRLQSSPTTKDGNIVAFNTKSFQGSSNTFRERNEFPDWLIDACEKNGYVKPTEMQEIALPVILSGKDVVVQAQTGSGKTLSFCLPILSKINPSHSAIQAVVIVPTRELGLQVASVLKQLTSNSPQKILTMSVIEGSNNRRQVLWAAAEPPHIVVGNPNSLQRLVDQGKLRLSSVGTVVIDEVDACLGNPDSKQELHKLLSRHLSNSFLDIDEIDIEEKMKNFKQDRVFRDLSKEKDVSSFRGNRQTILCSATIPQRRHFADICFRNGWTETVPELINVSEDRLLPDNIDHEVIVCKLEQRIQLTSFLLKEHFSNSKNTSDKQCIVFVDHEDKLDSYMEFLFETLRKQGLIPDIVDENGKLVNKRSRWISALSSGMNIDDRKESIAQFRNSNAKVLLCTGLAARGLDIPATSLVIQMSLPKTAEDYLHRSGRTGRLSRPGKVVSLIQEEEEFVIKRYMNELQIVMKRRTLNVRKS